MRELVNPFGANEYVDLFEIDNAVTVTVPALRHQCDSGFH